MLRASRPWEALYIYFTERSCPRRSPVFPDLPSRRCLAMSEQKSPHGSLELAQDQPLPAVLSLPGSSPTSTTLETTPCDFLVIPVPRYLRHNPAKPVPSSLFLNIIFAVATTFSECSVCAKPYSDIIALQLSRIYIGVSRSSVRRRCPAVHFLRYNVSSSRALTGI